MKLLLFAMLLSGCRTITVKCECPAPAPVQCPPQFKPGYMVTNMTEVSVSTGSAQTIDYLVPHELPEILHNPWRNP